MSAQVLNGGIDQLGYFGARPEAIGDLTTFTKHLVVIKDTFDIGSASSLWGGGWINTIPEQIIAGDESSMGSTAS